MYVRGVVICLAAILFMGIAITDDVRGSGSKVQWDLDHADYENEDFPSSSGTFGNFDLQAEGYTVSKTADFSQYSGEVSAYAQYYSTDGGGTN